MGDAKPFFSAAGDAGLAMIMHERWGQVQERCYTPERDDGYTEAQLWNAAHAYLSTIGSYDMGETPTIIAKDPPDYWPWAAEHWKPKGAIEDLVRAGALIAAEITRRIRAKARFINFLIEAAIAGGVDRPIAEADIPPALDRYLKHMGVEVGTKGFPWTEVGARQLAPMLIEAEDAAPEMGCKLSKAELADLHGRFINCNEGFSDPESPAKEGSNAGDQADG